MKIDTKQADSPNRPRIYVSGPISDGGVLSEDVMERNVRNAMRVGRVIWDAGGAPFIPHLTWHLPWRDSMSQLDWMKLDLPWVEASDAIYRIPGASFGSDLEVARACEKKIPVFHSLELLENWIKTWTTASEPTEEKPCASHSNELRRTFSKPVNGHKIEPSLAQPSAKTDTSQFKESNPKDCVGIEKVPFSTIPAQVMGEVGLAMFEGARKYGRSNWRVIGVRASVYYDAAQRHLNAWWEGEDIDPDSGLSHITKAIASLTVLRDAMLNEKMSDDRPPKSLNQNWVRDLNERAKAIISKYPNAKEPFTHLKLVDDTKTL